jgi:hypothetical protein
MKTLSCTTRSTSRPSATSGSLPRKRMKAGKKGMTARTVARSAASSDTGAVQAGHRGRAASGSSGA